MTRGVSVNIWVMFIILTYTGSGICMKKKSNVNAFDTVMISFIGIVFNERSVC